MPVHRLLWSLEVPEIPDLDSLPFCASSSDDQVPVSAKVDRLSTDLSTSNAVGDLTSSNVPKFNLLVPATRVHHVQVLLAEATREYLVSVGWSYLVSKCLGLDHTFLVPNF